MKIESSAFSSGERIPAKYTCGGRNISPPLSWGGIPAGAKGLALAVRDPDAPQGTFEHWFVHGIPADAEGIPEGGPLPKGAEEVENSFGKADYGGPCPPSGTHRYIFTLYALDSPSLEGAKRENFVGLAERHAIAKAVLIGLYSRE